jgi:hypothetical protein
VRLLSFVFPNYDSFDLCLFTHEMFETGFTHDAT